MNHTISSVNDTSNHLVTNGTSILPINAGLTTSQLVGSIVAGVALFCAIFIFCLIIIYQKFHLRQQKVFLTSNNPCYVSRDCQSTNPLNISQSKFSTSVSNGGHCNLSVSPDLNDDLDEISSLDNDNFLNSLEHLQFVGYLNNVDRTTSSIDHSLCRLSSASTVLSNQPIYPKKSNEKVHPMKHKSHASMRESSTTQVQLRLRKSNHHHGSHQHHSNKRNTTPNICNTVNITNNIENNHLSNNINITPSVSLVTTIPMATHTSLHNDNCSVILPSESTTGSTANLIGSGSHQYLAESLDNMHQNNSHAHDADNNNTNINPLHLGLDNCNVKQHHSNEDEDVELSHARATMTSQYHHHDNTSYLTGVISMPSKINSLSNTEALATTTNPNVHHSNSTANKMDSSTDSKSSINSTSAMMSGYYTNTSVALPTNNLDHQHHYINYECASSTPLTTVATSSSSPETSSLSTQHNNNMPDLINSHRPPPPVPSMLHYVSLSSPLTPLPHSSNDTTNSSNSIHPIKRSATSTNEKKTPSLSPPPVPNRSAQIILDPLRAPYSSSTSQATQPSTNKHNQTLSRHFSLLQNQKQSQ